MLVVRNEFRNIFCERSATNWQIDVLCQVTQPKKRTAGKRRNTEKETVRSGKQKAIREESSWQLKVLNLQEIHYQTDNEKSKKLTSELSSINDKVSNNGGAVGKRQELVEKESEALEEAFD